MKPRRLSFPIHALMVQKKAADTNFSRTVAHDLAILAMILSTVIPFLVFRWKGWL